MIPALDPSSKSLVKKHLSQHLIEILSPLKTDSGFTLSKAIASGIQNPDSSIGLYAGDAQSYKTFGLLFNSIINEYHHFSDDQAHQSDVTTMEWPCLDPDQQFIVSTRIRVARSLKNFNFPCHMDLKHRKNLEARVIETCKTFKGSLKGQYVSLEKTDPSKLSQLKRQGLLFEKGDRFQNAAGINTDFPKSRGVFFSDDKCFRIWVNEEDHLRIMSLETSADISSVFNRLNQGLTLLEQSFEYARDDRYGYLNSCPTNIGTAMRAGVHIRLKKLEKQPDILEQIAQSYQLQIRGTSGEKTKVKDAIFDISNRRRLGITESEIIHTLYSGVKAIIAAEKNL